jgi:hypothetical protein
LIEARASARQQRLLAIVFQHRVHRHPLGGGISAPPPPPPCPAQATAGTRQLDLGPDLDSAASCR